MERTTLDLWVGIFVVAGVAALVMLAMKVGNLSTYNMSDSYQVHAYFANIGGLKPKASIKSAGVLVGRVTTITLDTDRGQVRFMGRIQSQDERSLGVSLRDAMGRPAEGYASIYFDAGGNLQSASMDGNWGNQHFVASFNRRYAR